MIMNTLPWTPLKQLLQPHQESAQPHQESHGPCSSKFRSPIRNRHSRAQLCQLLLEVAATRGRAPRRPAFDEACFGGGGLRGSQHGDERQVPVIGESHAVVEGFSGEKQPQAERATRVLIAAQLGPAVADTDLGEASTAQLRGRLLGRLGVAFVGEDEDELECVGHAIDRHLELDALVIRAVASIKVLKVANHLQHCFAFAHAHQNRLRFETDNFLTLKH
mmetsp:Transcript_63662/g.160678  ORF Transcript_63662/g.160678 Transcript_63662/m.160678 type:complete len:220 (+) Transcript_63662:3-662(+)